jgi:WD40 repeat protein
MRYAPWFAPLLLSMAGLSQDSPPQTTSTAIPAPPATAPTPIAIVAPDRTEPVSFAEEVADILAAKCTGCHSAALAESKLNIEDVAGMLKGGKRGPAIVAGKADDSLLFRLAAHRAEPVMPPKQKKDQVPLTPEELGLLKRWIDGGAKDDSETDPDPAAARPITLGTLPPGVQPIVAVDLTNDGARVAAGRANVVQVYDVDSGLEIVALGGHKDIIQSVRFSPDGRRLAAGSYQFVTVWEVPVGGLKAVYSGHVGEVTAVASLADGSGIVSSGLDKTLRFWDSGGKPVRRLDLPTPVRALAVTPDGRRFAVVGPADNLVRVVDPADGKVRLSLAGHAKEVTGVAFLNGGARVASVSADGTGRIWTLPTQEEYGADPAPLILEHGTSPLRALAVHPDGKTIVTAGDDGVIRFWDADGHPVGMIEGQGTPAAILALAFDPAGSRLVAGRADRTARLFDTASRSPLHSFTGHAGPVGALAFSPDGTHLATGDGEGGVKVWDVASGLGVIAFGHTPPKDRAKDKKENGSLPIRAIAFGAPGSFVTASADATLKGWSFEGSWAERKPLGPHVFRVLSLDFNADGTLIAAGGGEPSRSGEVKIWEVGKGMLVRSLDSLHSDTVFGVRFSPDGRLLASVAADKLLKVTRVADGAEQKSFEGHTHHVLAVDWKSDGSQLATGGADNVIKVWDLATGEQLKTLSPAGKQVTGLRWVPDKPSIAGASGDHLVRIWNPEKDQRAQITQTLTGPSDYVFGVAVARDGGRIAAGGADGVLFIWDGQDGRVVRKFEPPGRDRTATARP